MYSPTQGRRGEAQGSGASPTWSAPLGPAPAQLYPARPDGPAAAGHYPMERPLDPAQLGITEGLVRMSCGVEDIEDLLGDVEQAFA